MEHLQLHMRAGKHTPDRLMEEYRKRVLHHEESEGPYPVSGPEIRRAASNHTWQATHSYLNGSNKATYIKTAAAGEERGLQTCVICARSMWKEELLQFHLFTKPADDDEQCVDGSDEKIRPDDGDDSTQQICLGVHRSRVNKVDALLSAEAYAERWPNIPKRELLGASVRHPFLENARWLLDGKGMEPVLNEDRSVKLDAHGNAPTVKACWNCAINLDGLQPHMPAMALANDNLLLRSPCVFRDGTGNPLSDATLLLLALARAVVTKEVAEPTRQVPQEEQQQVLKGNTLARPQADCRVLATEKLPPDLDILRPFLREHLAVVFCGKDITEKDRFPKLEVNWKYYVEAVRFLMAHNPEYAKVDLDEEAAKRMFEECGIPAVIKELITPLDVDETFVQPEGAAVDLKLLKSLFFLLKYGLCML